MPVPYRERSHRMSHSASVLEGSQGKLRVASGRCARGTVMRQALNRGPYWTGCELDPYTLATESKEKTLLNADLRIRMSEM